MMTPDVFVENMKNMSLKELLKERAKLVSEIKKFEKDDLPSDAWFTTPRPDEIYLWNLEALSKLCLLIAASYRSEHSVSANE